MTVPGPPASAQPELPSGSPPRPVWGADCPVSMPLPPPADEAKLVNMYGFSMTQYRLVHNISQPDYESLSVPVYAPTTGFTVQDDASIDRAGPPRGTP
jgi:hypothetical protein